MLDLSAVPLLAALPPPASPLAIALANEQLPAGLPQPYAAFLAQSNGLLADHLYLYQAEDIAERNATYEVAEYAPGYVAIGDDGGGQAILLAGGRALSPVLIVDHGSMNPDEAAEIAPDFGDWVEAGCPLLC